MIRSIATIGEPVLRQPARPLMLDELLDARTQTLIDDMIETMRHANGAGLAANQVFEPVQVCVIEVANNPRYPYSPSIPLTVLVNPTLEPVDQECFENYEGCLSVPNLRGLVPRFVNVRLRAWDRQGRIIDEVIRGLKAAVYQHECDHLQGTLFVDRVIDTKTLCTWDAFERHHKTAFVQQASALVARVGS